MTTPLLVDTTDPLVTTITLHRPQKRNALSLDLIAAIEKSVVTAAEDTRRRVLIIRGSGPAYCAGLDLQEASVPGSAGLLAEALARMYEAICTSPLITIAAAQGAALGGGAGLVLACDLVVAAEDFRIGFPEVHRGLVAALVTCLLRRQVDDRATRELILLGQSVPAPRAQALGLINRIVPLLTLPDAAMDLAQQACRGAPGAIARSKRLLDDLAPRPIADDLRRALAYHLEARNSGEAAEGMAAFLENRSPRWEQRRDSSM